MSMFGFIFVDFSLIKPSFLSLSATFAKCFAACESFSRSRPVSYSVPFSVATSDSVAGCAVPLPNGESAQSTISTPAIIAIRFVMSPVPAVLCVCKCIGTSISAFRRFTSEYASYGSSRFAISFIHTTSAPIWTNSFASFTKYSSLCTGLFV